MSALVILGSGFDIDLGLNNSCADYAKDHFCPVAFNKYWSDFENTLRNEVMQWYLNGKDEQKAKDLNQLWQVYVRNISWFFTKTSDKFTINKNHCAYKFLKRITANSKSIIYTFNYTNPYEYVDIPQVKDLIHLHGRYYKDTFNKPLMVMSQGHSIIFGINDCIPSDCINNPNIRPLIKTNHPQYKETDIITDLSKAKIVIFYGFSMNIIDYGYFSEFFNSINNGFTNCKKIYFVTLNKKGFKSWCDNLKRSNVDVENILKQITIVPVYTSKGFKNRTFRMMLRRL